MSQSYVDVSAMAGGLATATGALFTLVFAGVLSGKPDRVFRNLQDKRNQKVCLNMVAVSAEAFIAMMCWIGVRSTDGQALKAVLAVPAAAVTVLAFSQLVQSVVLRMDATYPDTDQRFMRLTMTTTVYLQRAVMLAGGLGFAFIVNDARNAVDPGRPWWHIALRILATIGPMLAARGLEMSIRHRIEGGNGGWLGRLYERLRGLYAVPFIACIAVVVVAAFYFIGVWVIGSVHPHDMSSLFGYQEGRTCLIVLGLLFGLMELSPSADTMSQLHRNRPWLGFGFVATKRPPDTGPTGRALIKPTPPKSSSNSGDGPKTGRKTRRTPMHARRRGSHRRGIRRRIERGHPANPRS